MLLKKAQDEIRKLVSTECPRAGELEKDKKTREQWTKTLAEMRDKNQQDYLTLMSLCFFFETVGMMVKLEYIDKVAIFGLFKGTILAVDNCFREHIDQKTKGGWRAAWILGEHYLLLRSCWHRRVHIRPYHD